MSKHGFNVTPHYHLPTAWVATYTHGSGGQRTIGINSEMDALPGIGHACGHNLIAIAGVSVACGIKAAMKKFNIEGKIVLLGTPGLYPLRCSTEVLIKFIITAEEDGNGKEILLKNGAYEDMDACLMYVILNRQTCVYNHGLFHVKGAIPHQVRIPP